MVRAAVPVTPAVAARRLRVSRSEVYRRIADGRLPAGKVGGRYRVSLVGAPPYRYANVPAKAMFRPAEVAAVFDVSVTTVYRLIRAGKLTAHRLERQLRIPRAAVLSYLDHVDDLGVEDAY